MFSNIVYLHKIRSEVVYDSAECHAIPPRRRHVGDLDALVAGRHRLTPLQQILGRRRSRRGSRRASRGLARLKTEQRVKT